MTAIIKRKSPLRFIAEDTVRYRGRYRRVVMEVERDGLTVQVRLEGTQRRYAVSFAGIYNLAVKIAVERERAERKAKRR